MRDCLINRPMVYSLERFRREGFGFIELNPEYYEGHVFPAFYVALGNDHYTIVLTKRDRIIDRWFEKTMEDGEVWLDNDEYGESWRCWSNAPTQKKRAATPWTLIDG